MGKGSKYDLTVGTCDGATWEESLDPRGNPQILANASGGKHTCLNVFDAKCQVGATVHSGPCQEDKSGLRKANHFHWDETLGAIASDCCTGFCVDAVDSNIVLAECAKVSAWTRSSSQLLAQ